MSEQRRSEGQKFLKEQFNSHVSRGKLRLQTMLPFDYLNCRNIDSNDRVHYRLEESVDISMRETDFERLLDILGHFSVANPYDQYHRVFERNLAFERKLREQHPGIKKAYERYRVLLDMVADGKEIED